jgi:hypothetical protein
MPKKTNSSAGSDTPLLLGIGLLLLFLLFRVSKSFSMGKTYPQAQAIIEEVQAAGYDFNTAKFWAAVSMFETADPDPWTSDLYKLYHNMFGMGYPTYGVSYGSVSSPEGMKSSYISDDQSIADLVEYLQYSKWPMKFNGIPQEVALMKQKGYFGGSEQVYLAGVTKYFNAI